MSSWTLRYDLIRIKIGLQAPKKNPLGVLLIRWVYN